MYTILKKEALNPTVTRMDIAAPLIARKAEPGQFVILRVDEDGERIPLTVADTDPEAGSVTIIFQIVGARPISSTSCRSATACTTSSVPWAWPATSKG